MLLLKMTANEVSEQALFCELFRYFFYNDLPDLAEPFSIEVHLTLAECLTTRYVKTSIAEKKSWFRFYAQHPFPSHTVPLMSKGLSQVFLLYIYITVTK